MASRLELFITQKNHRKVTDIFHTKSWRKGCPECSWLWLTHDILAVAKFLCTKTLLKAFMNKLEEWWVTYGFSEKRREGKLKIAAFTMRFHKEIVSLGARQRDYLSINNCLA